MPKRKGKSKHNAAGSKDVRITRGMARTGSRRRRDSVKRNVAYQKSETGKYLRRTRRK